MAYNRKDFFFKEAKKKNFAARSIFKLEEIDRRFKIFRKDQRVIDLGAAPGSWSQYASEAIGDKGQLLGVDLQPVRVNLKNAKFVQDNILEMDFEGTARELGFDFPVDHVISDMAPRTTGIKVTDQARSTELCIMALDVAKRTLKSGGCFVVKFFHSDDFEELRGEMKQVFKKIEILRPKSTRKESKEIFLIGIGFKGRTLK
jgi:23S rRNA (uridine2552-2'-O)-methyltransferase